MSIRRSCGLKGYSWNSLRARGQKARTVFPFYFDARVAQLWQNYRARSGLIGVSPVSDCPVSDCVATDKCRCRPIVWGASEFLNLTDPVARATGEEGLLHPSFNWALKLKIPGIGLVA